MSEGFGHPFHLVDESPWPISAANSSYILTVGLVWWFYTKLFILAGIGLIGLFIVSYQWWRDISRERSFQGSHTKIVVLGLQWGIILFICSEIFFFLSFFWAFFHSRLSPDIEIGSQWPPIGIIVFNPWRVPLLNTLVLVSSGVRVTWAHKSIEKKSHRQSIYSLLITILLGLYFTLLQGIEYYEASFSFADSIYGSTFYIATGFHGLHVIVGTLFLGISFIRIGLGKFSNEHHFGFVAAIWYWHFVDVVWLFLFVWIYVWGSWLGEPPIIILVPEFHLTVVGEPTFPFFRLTLDILVRE